MTSQINKKRIFLVLARILIVAILVPAAIFSGKFGNLMGGYGLVFVLVGGMAMALLSFSGPEIAAAFKHAAGVPGTRKEMRKSALFWEAAARNAWMLGILGSIINLVIALSDSVGGISGIASRMANSFVTTIYGMILGVICFVPAWKLIEELHNQPLEEDPDTLEKPVQRETATLRFENIIGYIVFIAITSWTIIRPSLSMSSPQFQPWEWIIYWPALLVVLGGTIAIVLFVGNASTGRPFTLSFALTGLIGSLMGFIQVLLAFSSKNIENMASAVTFIISSCFIALLGIMLVGAPLEDRIVKSERTNKHSTLSRVIWYIFPLVTLIFLVMTFVLVITPIKKG